MSDRIKEFYEDVYQKGDIRDNSRLYRWIIRLARPASGAYLLDIGAGIGCLLEEVIKNGCITFGLDISQEALTKAKKKLPLAKLCVANGEKIPFKDASFDNIVSLGSIEHFLNPGNGIKEITRLLKDNGRAILLLPNSFYLGDILKVLFKGRPQQEQWQIQEQLLAKDEWRELIKANGLRAEKIYGYNKYPEFFQRGTLKIKSIKKYIQTSLMRYLCPLNLSWQFVYVCRKIR